MIGITGFWMQRFVFKKEFYTADNYKPVLKTSPALFYSLDSSVKQLKEKFPGFTGYVIYFAQSKKGKTAIYGSQSATAAECKIVTAKTRSAVNTVVSK